MLVSIGLGSRSEVVIHLCSCLLSLVSVLEVQSGSQQAWAAVELMEGDPSCRRFYMPLGALNQT